MGSCPFLGVVLAKARTHNHRSSLLRTFWPQPASTTLTGVMGPGFRQDDAGEVVGTAAPTDSSLRAQRSNPESFHRDDRGLLRRKSEDSSTRAGCNLTGDWR